MIVSKHTPVVGVNLFGITVALKIEMETAAYSHKARAIPFAVEMLKQIHGLGTRRFKLILSSSGNTARALAVYTAGIPIKLFIVADALSPIEQLKPLRQFGHVELIVVDCPDKSGSHMAARRRTISAMKAKFGDDLIELDQYRSAIFPFGYASSLAPEIESQVPNLSEIFVPVGTCGLALGLELYRRRFCRRWRVVPVDVPGSRLFNDRAPPGRRIFSGIGNGEQTSFAAELPPGMTPIYVEPVEIARVCRYLADRRDIRVGASSGAAVAAFLLAAQSNSLAHCGRSVVICPDSADGYIKTLFDDDWLIANNLGKAILGP